MDDEWSFTFPVPDLPKGKKLTADEAEVLLQSRLNEKRSEFEDAVWQLARFYSSTKRQQLAEKYISLLITLTDDPERQASYWLALGQTMEQVDNFNAAIEYYKHAFSMEPTQSDTWYFINNNPGYSLLQVGRFEAAEPYSRAAIEIDPAKYNAHKNLGLSLQGQAKYADAAISYLQSIRANSADPRALNHLEALLAEQPAVLSEVPELRDLLNKSREAVTIATRVTQAAVENQMAASEELTNAQKILVAVGRIFLLEGRNEFSRDDVRRASGFPRRSGCRATHRSFKR